MWFGDSIFFRLRNADYVETMIVWESEILFYFVSLGGSCTKDKNKVSMNLTCFKEMNHTFSILAHLLWSFLSQYKYKCQFFLRPLISHAVLETVSTVKLSEQERDKAT